MIERTKSVVENHYTIANGYPGDADVVYGDSCLGDTPLLIRRYEKAIQTSRIDFLEWTGDEKVWKRSHGGDKETFIPEGLEVWSDKGWTSVKRVIRHKTAKQIWRVVTGTGMVDCTEDHSLLREDGAPVRPCEVQKGDALLHSSFDPSEIPALRGIDKESAFEAGKALRAHERIDPAFLGMDFESTQSFLQGLEHDGMTSTINSIDEMGKELCLGLWLMSKRLGFFPYLYMVEDKVHLALYGSNDLEDPAVARTVEFCAPLLSQLANSKEDEEYVYDLETDSHHFNVGPADLTVHNTDSVFVNFGVHSVKEAMALGKEAAALVTKEFLPPVKLEFEKLMFPLLLLNKKRYAGLYWSSSPDKPDKMDTKGLETVRRDNCRLVRIVIQECLRKILYDRDVKGAISYAQGIVSNLLRGKIDLSLLVITKSLGKAEYKGKQAHAELAKRLALRCPSTAPRVGDRMAYIVAIGPKGAKLHEKTEDAMYALEHSIAIDVDYYVKKQLRKPLERIFEPIMKNVDEIFKGEHTRTIKQTAGSSGGILAFAVKSRKCLGCKAVVKGGKAAVCEYCEHKRADLLQEHVQKVQGLEREFSAAWTECQRCQGSLLNEVLCSNLDCPIFFHRSLVKKELGEAQATLDAFDF